MENLGADMNFNGNDIDPNQLGFPTVTESSFNVAATPQASQGVLRTLGAADSDGTGGITRPGNSNHGNQQAPPQQPQQQQQQQQLYTTSINIHDYPPSLPPNITMGLESELPQGVNAFLTASTVSQAPQPQQQQPQQVATFTHTEGLSQEALGQAGPSTTGQLNIAQSLELAGPSDMAHLYSNTPALARDTKATSLAYIDAANVAYTTSTQPSTSTSASVVTGAFQVQQRAVGALPEGTAFVQQQQQAPQQELPAQRHSSSGSSQPLSQPQLQFTTSQVLTSTPLPSLAGLLPLPNKVAATPCSDALTIAQTPQISVTNFSQIPAESTNFQVIPTTTHQQSIVPLQVSFPASLTQPAANGAATDVGVSGFLQQGAVIQAGEISTQANFYPTTASPAPARPAQQPPQPQPQPQPQVQQPTAPRVTTAHTSVTQRQGSRLAASGLSQLLMSGALPQTTEVLTQLSLQLQSQGLSLPHISSVLSSLAKSAKSGLKQAAQNTSETAAVATSNVQVQQASLQSQQAMQPATSDTLPQQNPAPSYSSTLQQTSSPLPSTAMEAPPPPPPPPRPGPSADDRSKNEPEMMIYHDKMTRKNILVPIGPPNVTAGRNMAPSPMFLDDNTSSVNPTARASQAQVAEASSSEQPPAQSNNINVSDFLNLPPRSVAREAVPATTQASAPRNIDSPPDNLVSSTTQDIREDLPPFREILSRQQHYGHMAAMDIGVHQSGLLDSSHSAARGGSLTDFSQNPALLHSSFHQSGASGNDVMAFEHHADHGEAAGMLSLPEYEPISDSEEGEISTTCVMTPAPLPKPSPLDETNEAEIDSLEEEEDEETESEEEEEEEEQKGVEAGPGESLEAQVGMVLPQLQESLVSQVQEQAGARLQEQSQNTLRNTYSTTAPVVTQVAEPQVSSQLQAFLPDSLPLASTNLTFTADRATPSTSSGGYKMPFKKVEVQFLHGAQAVRPPSPERPDATAAKALGVQQIEVSPVDAANLASTGSESLSQVTFHQSDGVNIVSSVTNAADPKQLTPNHMLLVHFGEALQEARLEQGKEGPEARFPVAEPVAPGQCHEEEVNTTVDSKQLLGMTPVPLGEDKTVDEEDEEDEDSADEDSDFPKEGEDGERVLEEGEIVHGGSGDTVEVHEVNSSKDPITQKLEVSIRVEDSQCVIIEGHKKWICLQCPKNYSSKHNLVTHMLGHSGIKPHCCMVCGKFFKQQSHLQTHMLTHGSVKPHVCAICQRSFTQASHVKRHMAVHMERRPHICPICERGFVYPSELKIHMAKHKSGKANICADCGQSFASVKKLKAHNLQAHKDVSGLTCRDCGKSFTYPSQLRDHMLKHEGKRPFICGECGMDFMKEHHLKAHAFTHTGLRPFVCPTCNRSFNQKANLMRHMVVHENQRKYECDVCMRSFTQAQVLRAHMVTHADHKPYTCNICGKGFSRLHNLNGHMHMHSGEKPHICFCGASFTLKGNLNRHKKEKHNLGPGSKATTEEEAAQILNEMSAARRMQDNSSGEGADPTLEDSMDGSNIPKKKRKSMPRKTVKPDPRQEAVEAEIAEAWKGEEGAQGQQDESTTDFSNIDLISRFVALNEEGGAGGLQRQTTTDGFPPLGLLKSAVANSITSSAPLTVTPTQGCTTVTALPSATPATPRPVTVTVRGGRGRGRGRRGSGGVTRATLNGPRKPCPDVEEPKPGPSSVAPVAVSRAGRRRKKVSYTEHDTSPTDGGNQAGDSDDSEEGLEDTGKLAGASREENDPDWGGEVTVRRGGRRGRGRGRDTVAQQRGGSKGKVPLAKRLTYAANVFKSASSLDTIIKKGPEEAPCTAAPLIQLSQAGTVVQVEGGMVADLPPSTLQQLTAALPPITNPEPTQPRTKTDIVLPPKRRVSEIEKEAALLSSKPPENAPTE